MGWRVEGEKDGKAVYYAVYRDLQGRQRSAGSFNSKREADDAWQDAEADIRAGRRVGDPKLGRQRFRAYVEDTWFPNHVIEESTREGYTYQLNKHILDEFGDMRMRDILPLHVRRWVLKLQAQGVGPQTIRSCKVIIDAIFTTALNDQIIAIHPGRGVKRPPVARRPKKIITAEQFDKIYDALADDMMRLLVETEIESGLRWGELSELRVKDLDAVTGVVTIARAVVQLKSKARAKDERFVVKDYPKDRDYRQLGLAPHLVLKLLSHIEARGLGPDSLFFTMPTATPSRRRRPAVLPDPDELGLTEPNGKGRRHRHGTLTAYQAGKCRCRYCKDAMAAYRAERRNAGKDTPREPRTANTDSDGHIPGDWFRNNIWAKALEASGIGVHVTPHGLRHAHASWLLAGGADLQVVKERLGHGSITTTEGYLHALPGAHEAALKALQAVRGDRSELGLGKSANQAANHGVGEDPRDRELEELRRVVAQFRELLGPLGNTA